MTTPSPPHRAIVLDPADNVATALVPLAAGDPVATDAGTVTVATDIPRGHKLALRAIAPGEPVVKYGQPIGQATAPIAPGDHVHVHNCVSRRAGSGGRDA